MALADASPTFLARLVSYPLIKYSYDATLHCYHGAKESNTLVKRSLEMAEASVSNVFTLPLVQNVSKTCEPLLTKADQFGCSQLDKAEDKLFKPAVQLLATANAAIASSKRVVEEKVHHVVQLEQRAVQLLGSTSQQLLALPTALTNKVFDFAEESVDYYLPKYDEIEGDEQPVKQAPLVPVDQRVTIKSTWVRGANLTRNAYHRAQRHTARRIHKAKFYGEQLLSTHPLATSTLNYVKTRDAAARNALVQEVGTATGYWKDKVKSLLGGTPAVARTTACFQAIIEHAYVQTFYATLLTVLSSVISKTRRNTSTTASSSSSSSSAHVQLCAHEETSENEEACPDEAGYSSSGPAEPENCDEDKEIKSEDEEVGDDEPSEH